MGKLGNYVLGEWRTGSDQGSPLFDAVNGDVIAYASTTGIDMTEVLSYGRTVGSKKLRTMTFYEKGMMLKQLAMYLTKKKEDFYTLSYRTGATRVDSWIDIEGGFGNLFANASLRKNFPDQTYFIDGDPIDLSRGGSFMAHHLLVPKRGVAVHINAYNFPIWGMLEKCAVNWMAGVAAVVKPATNTSYLTEAVVREIIASGILPEGALQLICGSARDILDGIESQDVVTFTGSADTGQKLKSNSKIIGESVPFNMEADSLNASILGPSALPGTPEFDLFIKEVKKEMTVKCGQKCTAIRRIIVPDHLVGSVSKALSSELSKVAIGNPVNEKVRMGALASKAQVNEVKQRVGDLMQSARLVYGHLDEVTVIDADPNKGAFLSPILLVEENPMTNVGVHEIEAFGPVSTIMPYKDMDQAIALAQMGKGSLCCSLVTYDNDEARHFVVEAATHHGRILVLNRENAKQSTGHGSPLPSLVHGGPGRAGGGEEMGGIRGIKHYMQRCAVQATPTQLTHITGIYQQGSRTLETPQHPFAYHYDDIQVGMSLLTHKRTITDSDIQNFANLTWDVFYAHTDVTSLDGTIFKKRAAHGYFILAAAAGLFVSPGKGPVGANYGLDSCRFLRPIYHGDTIQVRLTCMEKAQRDSNGPEHPSGIVKWLAEVYDQDGEKVAFAQILTLVKKKSPFPDCNRQLISEWADQLKTDTPAMWGLMSAQHMIEHLTYFYNIALGKVPAEITTPEDRIEKFRDSLWNYIPMPINFKNPILDPNNTMPLLNDTLEAAKVEMVAAYDECMSFYKKNPEGLLKNSVFGWLDKYHFQLLNSKHVWHHFKQFGIAQ